MKKHPVNNSFKALIRAFGGAAVRLLMLLFLPDCYGGKNESTNKVRNGMEYAVEFWKNQLTEQERKTL